MFFQIAQPVRLVFADPLLYLRVEFLLQYIYVTVKHYLKILNNSVQPR